MNGCAPGLALIQRLKATRKWAIIRQRRVTRLRRIIRVSISSVRRRIMEQNSSEADPSVSMS